ncbi:MAG: sulfotransferase family protein [Oceanicoccus sp.]
MALDIIGAGFGRTGTLSLKLALEKLGFNKTYHMAELFGQPQHLSSWEQALATGSCDWDTLFNGYRAAVDWPACNYWQEYSELYPTAKVILSLRDPESWFDSVHKTIYPATKMALESDDPALKRWAVWSNQLIWENTFNGRIDDKEYAIQVFNDHVARVKKAIPADRLLVFRAADGWAPLCKFLECEVPNEDYPRVNSSEEFARR